MDPLLSTLILILIALVGARFSFTTKNIPAGPRLVFRTGTHFVFAGFLLGPSALGLVTAQALEQLFPFLALGLGWIGFLFGLQFERDTLSAFSRRLHLVAIAQAGLTFVLMAGSAIGALLIWGRAGSVEVLLVLLGSATACISAPAGIAMVSSNFLVRGQVRRALFFVASIDAVVGITILQLVYSAHHRSGVLAALGDLPATAWTLLSLGIGILCGIIFIWLTRTRAQMEELVLYLMGIAAFSAGAALQLQLSPLFVSLVMGVVVANLAPDPRRLHRVMARWEKPIYVILLILAGALLRFSTPWIIPLAIVYALLRGVSKVLATGATLKIMPLSFPTPSRLGLGLIPQGGISLAMALSALLTFYGLQISGVDASQGMFSVVVLGVVLSELVGPFLTTATLRRAGEISSQVEEALAAGDDREARVQAVRHRP